jgi:hypothetical protein
MGDNVILNSEDILNMVDTEKIFNDTKKKRGRPKKTHNYNFNNISKIKLPINEYHNNEDDEIILHMPISRNDIQLFKNSEKILENLAEKTINDNEDNNDDNGDNGDNNDNNDNNDNTIKNEISNNTDNNQELSNYYAKQYNLIIKKYKNALEEKNKLIDYLEEITPMYNTEIKYYPVNLNLFEKTTNNKLIPKETHIACWWCTYQFNNLPTFLPEKINNGEFYVQGCFCSFNCAAAYNLNLNDIKTLERYSLLKQLYYFIYKDIIKSIIDIEINIAGPKELLERYGGIMTIEEYRKNSKILGREYKKLTPPFIPLSYGFEETTISKTNAKNININNILNSKSKSENIMKRNTPIANNASLMIDKFIE